MKKIETMGTVSLEQVLDRALGHLHFVAGTSTRYVSERELKTVMSKFITLPDIEAIIAHLFKDGYILKSEKGVKLSILGKRFFEEVKYVKQAETDKLLGAAKMRKAWQERNWWVIIIISMVTGYILPKLFPEKSKESNQIIIRENTPTQERILGTDTGRKPLDTPSVLRKPSANSGKFE